VLAVSSLFFGLTASIFFANSTTFGLESNWSNCSSSEADLIIIPFFLVKADPEVVVFVRFISIAMDDGLCLDAGNFNRNTPCMLVAFFSQFWPSLKN
jgi:hypothetical protein